MSNAEAIYKSVQLFCFTLLLIMCLHLAIPMFELWMLYKLRQDEKAIPAFNLPPEPKQQRL